MLKLFISHSWDHHDDLAGLHRLISSHWLPGMDWCDLSVPRNAPLHIKGGWELRNAIRRRILEADVVLAFAGLYSSHSDWIDFEVTTGAAQFKPIVGVRPRSQQKLSRVVQDEAWEMVGWTSVGVREAIIRKLPQPRRSEIEPGLRISEWAAELVRSNARPASFPAFGTPPPFPWR